MVARTGPAEQILRPELVLTRIFDAPRELVFRAWTDPKLLAQWWGPKGFTNPVCEAHPRPGGAIRIVMRGPDGLDYPMVGVFQEIVVPERLVFTASPLDARGKRMFESLTTVTFAAQGDQTLLTVRTSVSRVTPEAAPHLAGMEQGWTQSLERLMDTLHSPGRSG